MENVFLSTQKNIIFVAKKIITHQKPLIKPLMKYGFLITLSALFLLGSCRNTPTLQEGKTAQEQTNPDKAKRNFVRRYINIPQDFNYIINLGSIDIIYTQGNFSVEVEGDSATLHFLHTDFDSNLLTVSIGNDGNTDYNFFGNTSNVKMYISCPDLKCVSICGNGSFASQATWRTEDLQLGVLGTGALKIGKVECTTLSIQSSDIGDISIADLHAEDATIYSRSSAHIDLNVDVNNLTVLNEGSQTITLTGSAHKVYVKNSKDPNLTNKIVRTP